jgi:dephospho-CoA kinase
MKNELDIEILALLWKKGLTEVSTNLYVELMSMSDSQINEMVKNYKHSFGNSDKDYKLVIVAFSGKKFSGKDTAAQILIDKYGYTKVAFADGLRRVMELALGEKSDYFTDPAKKEEIDPRTGKTRRYWLQKAGTDWFRNEYESIWIDWWTREIRRQGLNKVVVTDLRFPNELEAIRWIGSPSKVFRIHKPNSHSVDTHSSESFADQLDVDHIVVNSGTIEQLHGEIINCLCLDRDNQNEDNDALLS